MDYERQAPHRQTTAQAAVRAHGICKAYRRVPVLFPLSFSLESGRALALLGPNGSGKTTLLRLLAGLTDPSAGMITFGGSQASNRPSGIGFLGHDSHLYDDLTGYENLRFFLSLAGHDLDDVQIAETLENVSMRRAAGERVGQYSSGMKRRLGLARLLLMGPGLLLLDEPHASLDADGQSLVDQVVRSSLASGACAVIASHDQERTLALCDDVIVLDAGRTISQCPTSEWAGRVHIRLLESDTSPRGGEDATERGAG
ncbi:MAG TPA: heme ABC exporter ATP-binding protein CcmA [Chloroflexota bacterium]|jgi:heme exporter protein A|nr:heme ABC exporter ATP-binding protein CcmA [Chloroflexota bacterium]